MQVDQFESEVELLSVQTRKKKGDKEVGVLSLCDVVIQVCSPVWFVPPGYFSLFIANTDWLVCGPSASQPSPPLFYLPLFSLAKEVRQCVLHLSPASALMRITSLTTSFTFCLTRLP